jgi:hypothetical protein
MINITHQIATYSNCCRSVIHIHLNALSLLPVLLAEMYVIKRIKWALVEM